MCHSVSQTLSVPINQTELDWFPYWGSPFSRVSSLKVTSSVEHLRSNGKKLSDLSKCGTYGKHAKWSWQMTQYEEKQAK